MDGYQENIKDYKKMLIAWKSKLVLELRKQLQYNNFKTEIKTELGKSAQFTKLKSDESETKF